MPSYSGIILLCLTLVFPHLAQAGDKDAGEAVYYDGCVACHGQAGKGASSYPKVSGNDIAYTTEKLEAYRAGIKQGSNSALMIMMAKPLTDEEIANLAAYLEDAVYVVE